jgi:hypothetical protein
MGRSRRGSDARSRPSATGVDAVPPWPISDRRWPDRVLVPLNSGACPVGDQQVAVPSLYGFEGIFSAMLQISRFVVSHELDDTRP